MHCNNVVSEDFIAGRLAETLKKIGERKETRNPFKAFSRYRRNRLFVAATEKFNRQVKVACMTLVTSNILLTNIADHVGDGETVHMLVRKSSFSGDR